MDNITEIINLKRTVHNETKPSISKTENYIQEDGTVTKMINIILPESLFDNADKVMLNIQPGGKYTVDMIKLEKDINQPHDSDNYDLWLINMENYDN
jgi:hypothetical protein